MVCTCILLWVQLVMDPPLARVKPTRLETHGHIRIDDYYWLKERENEEVKNYLILENEYTQEKMADTKALQDVLFKEIKGRDKQDDDSVPYLQDGYYYYTRMETGKNYPLFCRRQGSMDSPEEIYIDANEMAKGHSYSSLRPAVSDDGQMLAFAHDTSGRRIYTLRFKNLKTGELLQDSIPDVTSNMVWANDNQTLFYARQNLQTLRFHQIYRHQLGTDFSQDVLVYEEKDETFSCSVEKTKSKRFLMIASSHTMSSEYRILEADQPEGIFRLFNKREYNHLYEVSHFGDHFFILSNKNALNYRILKTPIQKTSFENWQEIIPHREDTYLEGIEIFKNYMVLRERVEGLIHFLIRPWDGSEEFEMEFDEPAYASYLGVNPQFDTNNLQYVYSSLTTPRSWINFDMSSRKKTVLKVTEVLGDFHAEDYKTERVYATARDGEKIPISLVYRKTMFQPGKNPLLLYGYGSYGVTIDPGFRSSRLSLIDRGFVFAIAHVRGSQVFGRRWYEDGKKFTKKNTFTDFIDCGHYLTEAKYADKKQLFAQGGSAGGLLIGAVYNMTPLLFKGMIADVPFVDVVTTMLDSSIPLTTSEYDEWGDPNQADYYYYLLSYSPYDNVDRKHYTNLLVTTGFHDSQVQYWEPAKWVAKLRAMKLDNNMLLLKTNMEAGHGGASSRDEGYQETAFEYSFLLKLAENEQAKVESP